MQTSNKLIRRAVFGLALADPLSLAGAQEPPGVAQLSWLAGCWSRESARSVSDEQWMYPVAGSMLGMGRTIKAGKTMEFEFMRIHEAANGKLLYTALPSGQRETTFTQLRLTESEVAFENLQHDFPQRVIYRLQGDAALVASIEGNVNGKFKAIEFPMRRTDCRQNAKAIEKSAH